MKSTKQLCVQFDFVKDFACDGTKCNARCCRRWTVHVDAQHRHKLLNIPSKEMQQEIKERLRYDAENKCHAIILNDDGCCPFVGEDLLCRIQKNFGEEYLPDICVTYPRVFRQYRDYLYLDVKYSCPLVAKMSLLSPSPLQLEEQEIEIKRPRSIHKMIDDFLMNNSLDLRCTSMAILQNRQYKLIDRLKILGLFWSSVEDVTKAVTKTDEADAVIEEYLNQDFQLKLLESMADLPTRPKQFVRDICRLLEDIFEVVIPDELQDGNPYAGMFLKYFKITENNTIGAFRNKYDEAYLMYEKNILKRYPYLMENFLVYNIFSLNFPQLVDASIKKNYALYLIYYRILEMGLISLAGIKGEELSDDDVATYLSVVCKRTAHGSSYWNVIKPYVDKYGDDTRAFMQVWLA